MAIRKKKELTPEQVETNYVKDYFDLISPTAIKFFSDHYVVGNSYRCVWAIRDYPPITEEQAILSRLADKNGITLKVYNRLVDGVEQQTIAQNAMRKNKMKAGGNNINEVLEAQNNLELINDMITETIRNKIPLFHCAVFIEFKAKDKEELKELQSDVTMELTRSKMTADHLFLRQQEGFLSIFLTGKNILGTQFERVLPASAVSNLFPLNFSGKTDPHGIKIGRDKYGTNIVVDFDRRTSDKTNPNILILGNPGQGKSFLLKLIIINFREGGKHIILLDAEGEYIDLTEALGGCYIDFMSGEYIINPLEPKSWNDEPDKADKDAPEAFRKATRLSQHIAFLKDFFRSYKDFTDAQLDTIEILLSKLYSNFGINDFTDFSKKKPTDYPLMEDFYKLVEDEFMNYDKNKKHIYTEEILQEICLGIHSMCIGSESKYFNGHTNITDDALLCFGVKGLMDTNKRLKNTMLFNILAYMSNELLNKGNTMASIDEMYLFLTNMTAIEYIRNLSKRGRKQESGIILASQNVEDFLAPGIKEYTKPLLSIPTHRFLFYPGQVNPKDYIDALQVAENEFDLIKYPERGTCFYCCGNERYLLQVSAPDYKSKLFGTAGGR